MNERNNSSKLDKHLKDEKKMLELNTFLNKEIWNASETYAEDEITWQNTHRLRVFLKTPLELEKVLMLQFVCCFDNFLCFLTVYPLHMLKQMFKMLSKPTLFHINMRLRCYILYMILIVSCLYCLQCVQIPYLYHVIKKQSYMKLYVLYNMMEITDKLLSSIGYDIMDFTLLLSTHDLPDSNCVKSISMLLFSFVYTYVHVLVMLIQLIILNVAVFSQSNLLFIVVLSNQFTEVKSHVFKKFDQKNLLNVVNYDGKERFYVVIMLASTFFISCFNPRFTLGEMANIVGYLVCTLLSEIFIDWIKHSFITKFNYIDPNVYKKHLEIYSTAIINHVKFNNGSCISENIVRKIGFNPLPLVILVFHVFTQFIHLSHNFSTILLICSLFYCLLQVKGLTSVIILTLASRWTNSNTSS